MFRKRYSILVDGCDINFMVDAQPIVDFFHDSAYPFSGLPVFVQHEDRRAAS
jgi:hypothetical protein